MKEKLDKAESQRLAFADARYGIGRPKKSENALSAVGRIF
jgi:hypothetical protein